MQFSLTIKTPLGLMRACGDQHALHSLSFVDHKGAPGVFDSTAPIVVQLEQQLNEYFAGTRTQFSIPLAMSGTPFQQSVWHTLQAIPHGTTWSYAKLACAIGRPKAFRAVANANGANRFAIIIPCHRVINSDGKLGGYAAGVARKKWLLSHEENNHL